ncbi:hypothetical protein SAMN05421780_104163 [Flexibacter flexilis DSM 6793]|uniref:Uncharacterized protein n=1 Tax=Flexibacter flexilis DSM 6793 TaxID=927664 RepID=A0A1I1I160_9BACT|nr:hypothetical protein [Flexibacter flexilis]SFC29831.1 hypothetical protein SAMN05421780_104163 [Flexibacter flexilis DSM 6793]
MENKLNRQGLLAYGQQFSDKVLNDFFQQNEKVTGGQLLEFTPIRQVNLMLIKNLYEKWQAETRRLQSPYFDYSAESVQEALRNFMNTLSQNIAVAKADFQPLLEQSVHESLLLALLPAEYFESELNLLSETKLSPQRVKELGKYIQYNKVLLDAVQADIEAFHVKQVATGELVKAIAKKKEVLADKCMTLAQLVAEFAPIVPLTESDLLVPEPPPAPVTPPAPTAPANFFEAQFAAEPPTVNTPEPAVAPEPPKVKEVAPAPMAAASIPDWFDLPAANTPAPQRIADLSLSEDKSLIETFTKDATLNDVLKQEAQTAESVLDKIHKQKLESLHTAFPVHERFMYVNDLFGGDYVQWSMALKELEEAHNLTQAKSILSNLAQRFSWTDGERVKAFTEIVERKF